MINRIDARHRIKRSLLSGATPTIAPSEDFTDGTWASTDTRPGELFYNMTDNRCWIGNPSGFSEFSFVDTATTYNSFCRDGLETSALSGCSGGLGSSNIRVETNLSFSSGNTIAIDTGSTNSTAGVTRLTLGTGSAYVSTTAVDSTSLIFLTKQGPPTMGSHGHIYINGITGSTGFGISSTSIDDDSLVAWLIIKSV